MLKAKCNEIVSFDQMSLIGLFSPDIFGFSIHMNPHEETRFPSVLEGIMVKGRFIEWPPEGTVSRVKVNFNLSIFKKSLLVTLFHEKKNYSNFYNVKYLTQIELLILLSCNRKKEGWRRPASLASQMKCKGKCEGFDPTLDILQEIFRSVKNAVSREWNKTRIFCLNFYYSVWILLSWGSAQVCLCCSHHSAFPAGCRRKLKTPHRTASGLQPAGYRCLTAMWHSWMGDSSELVARRAASLMSAERP